MKGSYILVIELKDGKTIQIGKLGKISFKKGHYVYVGSALSGLEHRINRHLKKTKKKHWHIDYFLSNSRIIDVFYKESQTKIECDIAGTLNKNLDSISGFGCSDCRCKSHLFYGTHEKIRLVLKDLKMIHFEMKNQIN